MPFTIPRVSICPALDGGQARRRLCSAIKLSKPPISTPTSALGLMIDATVLIKIIAGGISIKALLPGLFLQIASHPRPPWLAGLSNAN